ncbi:hypothetical protein [Streptomyces sp. NRRL F-5123]|uniref:hypothetical protein n=1 Tax=Streptomyces sp. NRRL F-5123 TaxID=1463856 RepID=UPI0004E159A5|nr:hypothetical protein [Streptomyces sp. NRRL F-5123]
METETVETEQAPKKGGRRPDPMTQLIADVKAAIKNLGEYEVTEINDQLRQGHDRRAAAWSNEYRKSGRLDGLILGYAFEVLSSYEHERRHALVQLAAVALNEAARPDGAR